MKFRRTLQKSPLYAAWALGMVILSALLMRNVVPSEGNPEDRVLPPPVVPKQSISVSPGLMSPTQSVSETGVVERVIDGDTVVLADGRHVRYIGMNTPEIHDPRTGAQCYGNDAFRENKLLVEGKGVRMEKDVSETDKYGRLLRYVWIDGMMINDSLVRRGFARVDTVPPDVRYARRFIEAEEEAQRLKKGLWGDICQRLGTGSPPQPSEDGSFYPCDCSRSCSIITSCKEAQYQLVVCGCTARDGDGNGIACNGEPLRCTQ